MNTTSTPTNPGAAQSVADSTALAALDIDLTEGTRCYNADVDADFVLRVSTASLSPDEVVAVAGNDGLRWIKDSGGGGGSVDTIVAGDSIAVDATDPANPIVSVTNPIIEKLPNAASDLVTALQLLASLTTNTAGAEASKVLVKLLAAGAVTQGLSIEPNALGIGDKLYFANDSGADTYIIRGSENAIQLYCAGIFIAQFNPSGLLLDAGVGAQLTWGSAGVDYNSPTGRLWLHANGSTGNVQLGGDAVNATAATGGYVTVPNCAGTPTGVPASVPAGQTAMIVDTTANKLWCYVNGAWKSAALT